MIPIGFDIRGSLGVLAGLNREELSIDLTGIIPDDAITVALIADNGGSKSTLMNLALTPWRNPPMLQGTLYDEFGEIGLRKLVWSQGDDVYRSRIELKQTEKTKSQKAYLHLRMHDRSWKPVRLPDGTVSDGKTSTYDACLEHILGPQNLYYLSAFRAQGAPKLGEYDDPKQLMEDLLSLAGTKKLRDDSKSVVRELRRDFDQTKEECKKLDKSKAQAKEIEENTADIAGTVADLIQKKVAASRRVAAAKSAHEKASKADADDEEIRQRRGAIAERIEAQKSSVQPQLTRLDDDLEYAVAALSKARRNSKSKLDDLIQREEEVTHRQTVANDLVRNKDAILGAASKVESVSLSIVGAEKDIDPLDKAIREIHALTEDRAALVVSFDSAMEEDKYLKAACTNLEKTAAYTDVVPCHGVGKYGECPALVDAKAAVVEVENTKSLIDIARQDMIRLDGEIKAVTQRIDAAKEDDPEKTKQDLEASLANLRNQKDVLLKESQKLSGLQQAETILEQASADLKEIEQRKRAIVKEADDQETQSAKTRATIETRKASVVSDNVMACNAIQAELDALPEPDPSSMLQSAVLNFNQAERDLMSATTVIGQTTARIDANNKKVAEIRADLDTKKDIIARTKRLGEEISHWNLLSVALQGVIDLTIEDAGPEIAATANKLLRDAYGPRFTVGIVTQRTQANGRVVETFDISVIDSESGLEASVLRKSGGEGVWLDKALTDSVGIFHQAASGRHYECTFADESEDGLTAERKKMFYLMDRAALKLGGYQRKFFVSHNPDAWGMADAIINLEDWRR